MSAVATTPRRTKQRFTREALERAVTMHDRDGLGWAEFAAALGYGQNSLEATVCRFRRGQWAPVRAQLAALDAAMERMIAERAIVHVPALADAFGMKACTAQRRLLNLGLDREMREALAAEHRAEPPQAVRAPAPLFPAE